MAIICLVVLCGLPASGKSHLSKQLQFYSESSGSQSSKFVIVEYDRLLPPHLEKILILSDSQQQSNWKRYRAGIVKCVDNLIQAIKKGNQSSDIRLSLDFQLEKEVTEALWEKFTTLLKESSVLEIRDSDTVYIMIDDNMYYSSMRYNFYQLARKYEIGFCQIYLQIDVDIAISQNAKRDIKVADDVITTMATKMEPPDWSRNSWEEHSITFTEESDLKSVHELLQKAVSRPVQPVEDVDVEQQNQSRVICSESFVYQSDIILRRLVSQEMSVAKDNSMTKPDMKSLAGLLQTVRKHLLDCLKSGTMEIPRNLVSMATDSSKDTNSELYQFIEEKFHSHLKDIR